MLTAVTLLGSFEDDEYLPEFGTLIVRDHRPAGMPWEYRPSTALLDEHDTDAQPCGTVARAGHGWLEGAAGDGYITVRMELHDSAPPVAGDWPELLETPYRSATGIVGLSHVTGGDGQAELALGDPGCYRVRVAFRRDEEDPDGDRWLLAFWPESEPIQPPRWLTRRDPVVRPPDPGWREVLGYEVEELRIVAWQLATDNDRVTAEQLADWGRQHNRGEWLDEPLWPDPPEPLPTGHADLDRLLLEQRRATIADRARKRAELVGVAAQLHVPAPTTRRELLPLLVAAGLLSGDDATGYRAVEDPPLAQDVLELPPERVAILKVQQDQRFCRLASDVVSVALWAGPGTRTTVADLAERLIAAPQDIRDALAYAVAQRLLSVDLDNLDAEIVITVLPKKPPERMPAIEMPVVAAPVRTMPAGRPLGAPPRAGMITAAGEVIRWNDGVPTVLARVSGPPPIHALESAHGIVLLGSGPPATLVRPDGSVEQLGDDLGLPAALGGASSGSLLAAVESRFGRQQRYRLHVVDLADGTRQTMPFPEDDFLRLLGMSGDTVYFNTGSSFRWRPGAAPESLEDTVLQVDGVTGTYLAAASDGLMVVRPDGTRVPVAVDRTARLVPGARKLYAYRHVPPAITIFDIPSGNPTVHWLPELSQLSTTTPGGPIWEDAEHLVVPVDFARTNRAEAVRLHLPTGSLESVPWPPDTGRSLLIEVFLG